jgi:hypothetical protein
VVQTAPYHGGVVGSNPTDGDYIYCIIHSLNIFQFYFSLFADGVFTVAAFAGASLDTSPDFAEGVTGAAASALAPLFVIHLVECECKLFYLLQNESTRVQYD